MPDSIYLIDPVSKVAERFAAVSFAAVGIKERSDLQEWVLSHPQMLGESLFTITSEFNRFDKSNKRLDILALDSDGKLVVVELKLDAHDSLAELQAIRYAAFCSTMTMEDAITERARFRKESRDEAAAAIRAFLETDDLPELDSKPRIIIAAGSMDDQELTSTALWLRDFGLDITCVELTPYKLTAQDRYVLVPRVIIPIPEAKEYLVGVQRKEAAQQKAKAEASGPDNSDFWKSVACKFNQIASDGFSTAGKSRGAYMKVKNPTGFVPGLDNGAIHYEWILLEPGTISVALHFETKNPKENQRLCQAILLHSSEIRNGIQFPFDQGDWDGRWRDLRFITTGPIDESVETTVDRITGLMKVFIDRSSPILEHELSSAATPLNLGSTD